MGWSSLSFPFGSLLTAAKMTQVYSNFASALAQESGAPPPSGVWSFRGQVWVASDFFAPGSSSFGHVSATSGFSDPGSSSFGHVSAASGFSDPGSSSFGHVSAGSGFSGPGVSSFDAVTVGSLSIGGNRARQLLQRVHVFDATSRSSGAAVYSTYTVGSITPVSSLSSIRVLAGVYYTIIAGAAVGVLDSNLVRNPAAASSLALLTSCGNNMSISGEAIGTTGFTTTGMLAYDRVDSAGNLDPKQYGVNWQKTTGTNPVAISAGYVTLEEWL